MIIFKTIPEYLQALNVPYEGDVGDFFVFRIEDYEELMPKKMEAYKKDFFQITYGKGHNIEIKINESAYNPIERMLSFSTPFHMKSWKLNKLYKDSLSYMILFKPEVIGNLYIALDLYKNFRFFNFNSKPTILLSDQEGVIIENLIKALFEEFQNKDESAGSRNIISAYLSIILEKTNGLFDSHDSKIIHFNRAAEIAFKFENLLKQNSNYQLHLGYYADQLNISTTYLSESIKKATGKSAKSVATEILVLNAKSLLLQQEVTIASIAESIGFNDPSNFIKFFKTNTGYTPHQFRRQH